MMLSVLLQAKRFLDKVSASESQHGEAAATEGKGVHLN